MIKSIYLILFGTVTCFLNVHAHPHQFVDYQLEFIVTSDTLSGIKVDWAVDEMISQWIIEDFGLKPGDTFTGDAFTKYVDEVFYELRENYYYARASLGGKPVKPYRWSETSVTVTDDNLLVYRFMLPFGKALRGKPFTFRFMDDTFYIDFSLAKGGASVSGSGAAGVSLQVSKNDYDDLITVIPAK